MHLHLFAWNLGKNDSNGSTLLNLIDRHANSLGGAFLGWICEPPSLPFPKLSYLTIVTPSTAANVQSLDNKGAFLISQQISRVFDPDHSEHIYSGTYSAHFKVGNFYIPVTGTHLPGQQNQRVGNNPENRVAEAKDRLDRISSYWLRPSDGTPFHPSLERHIAMGDFNDEPHASAISSYQSWASTDDWERVCKQKTNVAYHKHYVLRYNPARSWIGPPRGSFHHSEDPTVCWRMCDQIILAPNMAQYYVKDSFKVIDSLAGKKLWRTLNRKYGQSVQVPDKDKCSDHFPVQLTLELP